MDIQSRLDYLYGLQLFGVKLGLQNMQDLKARLPAMQAPLPAIHVAGTNGKGSVSMMLTEILRQAGWRVGLYTSPHLQCFSERIQIDGRPVTLEEVARLTDIVRAATGEIPVTFFEATTAMALQAFHDHQVDLAVIETGLGGRLDATNIISPVLCLITPVSLDHSEHLGDSLAAIAAEKAGILKPGVPLIVGRQPNEALEVIESVACRMASRVCLAGRDYAWSGDHDNLEVVVEGVRLDGLSCALAGTHQLDNFAQAVAAALNLRQRGFAIPETAIRAAGRSVVWPGRLEWWDDARTILADVSHNRAGIDCLVDYLQSQDIAQVHLVVGLSGLREPEEILKPLAKFAIEVYAVPVCGDRVVPASRVADWARSQGLSHAEYRTAADGFAAARLRAGSTEPVVICGSLYLVGELRQMFLREGAVA